MKKLLTMLLLIVATTAMAQNDTKIGVYDLDKSSVDEPTTKGKRTETVDTLLPAQAGVNVQGQIDHDTLTYTATAPLVKITISQVKDDAETKINEYALAEATTGKIPLANLPENVVIKFSFLAKDGSEAEILMDN